MSTENFGSAPDNNIPPPRPGYSPFPPATPPVPPAPPAPQYGQVPPPVPGYGQSAPPPAPMPTYGQVPPAPVPPMPGQYMPTPYPSGGFQPVLATWQKRAYGALIDWVAPFVVLVASGFIFTGNLGFISYVFSLAGLGYFIYNNGYLGGTTGVTFGRKFAGTKLVSEATLAPIGAGMGIARYFVHFIDAIICYVGFLFPLWTPKKQTIADILLKTIVIEER